MDTVVIIVLVSLGVIMLVGVVVAWIALRNAPDGFEDQHGFHRRKKPKP